MVGRRHSFNIQVVLGHEGYDEELGAWASDFRMSESNHRASYRRWAQMMDAESWAEL